MWKKIIFLSIMGCIFFVQSISAQEVPVLQNVEIKTNIKFEKNTKIYRYSYKVINPETNTGQIDNIQIDISKPEGSINLSSEGFIIQRGADAEGIKLTRTFDEEMIRKKLSQGMVVPIGTEVPPGWRGGLTVVGNASWGSKGKTFTGKENKILPGQSLSGFAIISRGLPTIRDISVHPKWVPSVEGYVTEEDIKTGIETDQQITFKGKTIGPTAPPADFKAIDFLNYIIDLKHQAVSLGWITNKGIENSLDVKLDGAKKKIEQGNIIGAKNILEAFINEAEAQGCESYEKCPKGKHLTPEAYALLKYNVQYLIERL